MGFERAATADLLTVRGNLLRGLERVAVHVEAGTLHITTDLKCCPPVTGGHITLALLRGIDAELLTRGHVPDPEVPQ